MENNEIKKIFDEYLFREPTSEEYKRFSDYNYEKLEKEIKNCPEISTLSIQPKTAILISGHPRNLSIVESLKNMNMRNVDVFVFSWDQWGHRTTERNIEIPSDRENIESIIKNIPGVKKYKIENNADFIKNNDNLSIKYINWIRGPEVYVKSQLYAISKSYELMEQYIKETKTEYSLVIKCRFENSIERFQPTQTLINDIENNKIIFVPNNSHHTHPFNSYCEKCQMIYEMGYRHTHIFNHDNPVCDVYAYGSVDSMKDYCSLYYKYDDLCKKFEKHNMKMMDKLQTPHEKRGEAYILNQNTMSHDQTVFFYFSSYPERLLSYILEDYMLLRADEISLGWRP